MAQPRTVISLYEVNPSVRLSHNFIGFCRFALSSPLLCGSLDCGSELTCTVELRLQVQEHILHKQNNPKHSLHIYSAVRNLLRCDMVWVSAYEMQHFITVSLLMPSQGLPTADPKRHGGEEDRGGLPGFQLELDQQAASQEELGTVDIQPSARRHGG